MATSAIEMANPQGTQRAARALAAARATRLMAYRSSFDGHGQRPLGECPTNVLRDAHAYYSKRDADMTARPIESMRPSESVLLNTIRRQIEAIALVLASREEASNG